MKKGRYRRTLGFLSRIMLRITWWEFVLPSLGLGALARRTRPARMRNIARSFRERAVKMGGVMIKAGQFLSSRLDVLPKEITEELAGLQDEVAAEDFAAIRRVVEAEFGEGLERRFEEFSPTPLAAASIGQVHLARLRPEKPGGAASARVVVKVQRPGIGDIIEADLAALGVVARRMARVEAIRRHADVPALVEEFSRSLREEIDYVLEGRNAERFAKNLAGRREILAPAVYWSHTKKRVLTLEYIEAIKITDYAAIEAAGIDRAAVAELLLDVYLKQVFEDGFFHADPHPGNLFVLPAPPGGRDWKLVFVDFGMTGSLAPEAFSALREGLLAVGTKDPGRLLRSFQSLHMLLPGADLELLERAIAQILEGLWGRSTKEMLAMSETQARSFIAEFEELLYDMPFQVPEDLVLLGRCVGILSGMASGLNPDFSVWKGLLPYVTRLMRENGEGGVNLIVKELGNFFRLLVGLPKRIDGVSARIQEGKLDIRTPDLKRELERLEMGFRKLAASIVFSGGLVAGTLFYLAGQNLVATAIGAVEVLLGLWIIFGK